MFNYIWKTYRITIEHSNINEMLSITFTTLSTNQGNAKNQLKILTDLNEYFGTLKLEQFKTDFSGNYKNCQFIVSKSKLRHFYKHLLKDSEKCKKLSSFDIVDLSKIFLVDNSCNIILPIYSVEF